MASELKLTAEQLAELERLIDRATEGPWMVFLSRESGSTQMHVMQHTHTGVALDRAYWANEDRPEGDENGYLQPDALCDVPENRLAVALLIGKLREYAPALIAAAKRDQNWTDIIADELGETMRLMEALGVVAEVESGTACMDAMLAAIGKLQARATAAEARVGELTKALKLIANGRIMATSAGPIDIARTALKPQGEERT